MASIRAVISFAEPGSTAPQASEAAYGRRAALRKAAALAAAAVLDWKPARADAPPRKLLMLGDSITAAYGLAHDQGLPAQLQAALRKDGENVEVVDAGVSGDTTAGGRNRLDWALADKPDAVIVALGGNDGLRGLDPKESRANLGTILDTLRDRRVPALLAGMLAPPNLGADYGREFAAVFSGLAHDHPEVVFYPFLLDGVAANAALNQADGIHPNPQGVAIIVGRMLPAVRQLLARTGS